MALTREPLPVALPGAELSDVLVPGPAGQVVVAVPTTTVGPLQVFPAPSVLLSEVGTVCGVVLDVTRWLVCDGEQYMQAVFPSHMEAVAAAEDYLRRSR
ncbi:hypothetical protein L6E12_21030 [Actinokineospora sp. PR83]|uniref:hypothetical protein n=1 Tax=Actinokineospora sp. PR83 TaxID=2884908 RepID=UPI001F338F8C|nr:hypothetical protein [Actinokineospora sp. PR83]MCG8918270.1 hypothetical protein [Actinokineospora sp. PR83]